MNENLQKLFNSIPRMFRGIAMNAVAQCKSPEEIISLAANYNIELAPGDAEELYREFHKEGETP